MQASLLDVAEDSVRGGFWLFLGDFASTAISAIGFILVARFLGPAGYGLYSLVLVVPTLFSSLISLGMDQAVLRFLAKFRAENGHSYMLKILSSALAFKLITGVATSLLCFLFSGLLAIYLLNRPEIGFHIKLASILILFQTLFNFAYNAHIGLDRAKGSSIIKILMSIVKASVAPTLIILGFGVVGAITGHVLCFALAGIVGTMLLYLGLAKVLNY